MPQPASRRTALAGLGALAAALGAGTHGATAAPPSAPGPDHPATRQTGAFLRADHSTPTPTTSARPAQPLAEALAIPASTASIALWGSSSMEGGLGAEYTPRPVYIHDELTLTVNPLPVYNVAYGAQWSNHTTLLRGIDTPVVRLPAGYSGGKVPVQVQTDAAALWTFTCAGQIEGGPHGTLTGSAEHQWFFEADVQDTGNWAATGRFISDWKDRTEDSRHVIWTGKNNIADLARVNADVDALVRAARDPEADVIVLGQWVTRNDLAHPKKIANVHQANRIQGERYGRRFIDVQGILTSEKGLSADPIWDLGLMSAPETQKEREQGIVPTPLRGTDGIHLSGWGNLLVAWALIDRMKELRWL